MKNNFLNIPIFIFYFLISVFTYAQKSNFLVEGRTNLKTENVWLLQPWGKEFNLNELNNGNQTKVDATGSFSFEGNLEFPTLFLLLTDNHDVSDVFFLENNRKQRVVYSQSKGSENITINITGSAINDEYIKLKKKLKESYVKDSLENEVNKGIEDYIIFDYIKQNPHSYVGLWLLIKDFSNNRPNRYQKEALSYFSDSIKKGKLYTTFINRISAVELFRNNIKNGFVLKNKTLEKEKVNLFEEKGKKYVLLDFWFSYCGPCIREMPQFVDLYNKYNELGFDIIGISVDREKDLGNWKKKMNELQIPWKNYWDEKSQFSNQMNVSKYPTTFLFNSKGELVSTDVSLLELDTFLQNKLKNK